MKILGIITARKNSRRIKNKNRKILGNKILAEYTFQFVKKLNFLSDVLVTTDDSIILEKAKKYSLLAPWLRPSKISKSTSTSYETVMHALKWYKNNIGSVDAVALFQPTSPFRKIKTIKEAFRLFKKYKGLNSIASVSYTQNKVLLKKNKRKFINMFCPNGLIFIISIKELKKYKSFLTINTIPLINNDVEETLDIDYPSDWSQAIKILKKHEK